LFKEIYPAIFSSFIQDKRLDQIANNLANVNTAGYKQHRVVFDIPASTDLGNKVSMNSEPVPAALLKNHSINFDVVGDFSQGTIQHTGNSLDLALSGSGFFEIETPQGIRYTRNGNFTLNSEGKLVTQDGFPVIGENGNIIIKGNNISISPGGKISVDGRQIDSIKLIDFPKPYGLKRLKNSLYGLVNTNIKEEKSNEVEIKQGFLELSNINPISEMTRMINVMRSYESYQKVITMYDVITSKVVNELGRLM